MIFTSSVPPERRAELRRLRAAFERAYDAMGGDRDPSTPRFRAADARYRAWIGALDAVAVSLLDDVDAFEAGCARPGPGQSLALAGCPGVAPACLEPESDEIERLFAGIDDLRRSADLIAPAGPSGAGEESTAKARAKEVVGHDRVARHWSIRLGEPA